MKQDENTAASRFEQIVEHLLSRGVNLIVIGGQAETLYGSPRVTFDTDLCHERTPENLERLAVAVRELKPSLRGAPADLPFRLDAQSLALGNNFTFDTDFGALDLLGWVEPIGTYENLLPRAELMTVGAFQVSVIGIGDLIRIKQYIARPKDQQALVHLLAIQKSRQSAE